MKKFFAVMAGVMMVVAMTGAAFAASVDVTASVQNKCGTMTDGSFTAFNIDPDALAFSKTTAADGISPAVKCTKGSTVTVTCPAGTQYLTMAGDTGGDIPYTVTCPGTYVAGGFSAADDVNIQIDFPDNAAAQSAAGAHTGTITVTVAN